MEIKKIIVVTSKPIGDEIPSMLELSQEHDVPVVDDITGFVVHPADDEASASQRAAYEADQESG
ncbi:hypothetical protein C4587_01780 [Candidatus Parcubacteria bacterium]|nr:MAG: hypothetical protein C4587_01780 [Candidatus Parcubacteria bacterium]